MGVGRRGAAFASSSRSFAALFNGGFSVVVKGGGGRGG